MTGAKSELGCMVTVVRWHSWIVTLPMKAVLPHVCPQIYVGLQFPLKPPLIKEREDQNLFSQNVWLGCTSLGPTV